MASDEGKKGKDNEKKKTWPAFALWVSRLWQAIEEEDASKPLPLDAGLYIVATPIGNLGDITLRALWALRQADLVLCEDTRVGGKLLALYGLKKTLMSCHDHNESGREREILERLKRGQSVALISDAGTPLIADPGYRLVCACRNEGFPVFALPGASALLTALAGAGLPTDRFLFVGFLPAAKAARRKEIESLSKTRGTLVFYESPHRLAAALSDMADILGAQRKAVVARELTKLFEENRTGYLPDLAAHYGAAATPKGEAVILVAQEESPSVDSGWETCLALALKSMSVRDAVEATVASTGAPKGAVYKKALALQDEVLENEKEGGK